MVAKSHTWLRLRISPLFSSVEVRKKTIINYINYIHLIKPETLTVFTKMRKLLEYCVNQVAMIKKMSAFIFIEDTIQIVFVKDKMMTIKYICRRRVRPSKHDPTF